MSSEKWPPCGYNDVAECTPKDALECLIISGSEIEVHSSPGTTVSQIDENLGAVRGMIRQCATKRIMSGQFKKHTKPKGPLV